MYAHYFRVSSAKCSTWILFADGKNHNSAVNFVVIVFNMFVLMDGLVVCRMNCNRCGYVYRLTVLMIILMLFINCCGSIKPIDATSSLLHTDGSKNRSASQTISILTPPSAPSKQRSTDQQKQQQQHHQPKPSSVIYIPSLDGIQLLFLMHPSSALFILYSNLNWKNEREREKKNDNTEFHPGMGKIRACVCVRGLTLHCRSIHHNCIYSSIDVLDCQFQSIYMHGDITDKMCAGQPYGKANK